LLGTDEYYILKLLEEAERVVNYARSACFNLDAFRPN